MSVDLLSIIPKEDEIEKVRLESVQGRLVALLRDQYPDVDVSPNSVFYDNVLRPMAYVVAGFEQAADCVMSDLDLDEVVVGNICDCDFVKDYLKTLGVNMNNVDTPSIATIRITYNTDATKTMQNSARFVFADTIVVRPLTVLSTDITVLPSEALTEDTSQNIFRLNKDTNNTFFVDIPVYGISFSELDITGLSGSTDVSDASIVSIRAVTPLTVFTEEDTVQNLAAKAQKVFPSAALTTRSSAVSFFVNKLSNLAGISPVITGDTEMTRGNTNMFGVTRNAVDLFPKGKSFASKAEAVITVTKDTSDANTANHRWKGRLVLPHIPTRIRGFYSDDDVELTPLDIIGASKDTELYPGLSGAFSRHEELGLVFDISVDVDAVPGVSTDGYVSESIFDVAGNGSSIVVDGDYQGHIFSSASGYDLTLTRVSANSYTLKNNRTGEEVTGLEVSGGDLDIGTGSNPKFSERWLSGLTITVASTADGASYLLNFEGEQGRVTVVYDYDPFVEESFQLVSQDALHGAIDIDVIAPRPCVLSEISIQYRTDYGRWVDTGLARSKIYEYVNQAIYPEILEDSRLSDITLFAGAKGIRKISKAGILYATLATKYSQDGRDTVDSGVPYLVSGTDYENQLAVDWSTCESNYDEVQLDNADNFSQVGPRNVQFLIDAENITLVEFRN